MIVICWTVASWFESWVFSVLVAKLKIKEVVFGKAAKCNTAFFAFNSSSIRGSSPHIMLSMVKEPEQVLNDRGVSVEDVMLAWPRDCPLVMLHSAGAHSQWGRWSILAKPERFETFANRAAPACWLNRLLNETQCVHSNLPFAGGWIGFFSYELGHLLEPAARSPRFEHPITWPMMQLAHCPAALVHDNVVGTWHTVGETNAANDLIEHLQFTQSSESEGWQCGDLLCERPADTHVAAVSRTKEYIAAGDIFQANITQQFRADFAGCTRSLARHALARSAARYGAYLELPDGNCLISMSPELFLQVDGASRRVITRPIKGTRPQHTDPQDLARSCKDAAELHMITDLMRNDLGRVCEFGSIHVTQTRGIESHPTVHHGVSTVEGRLRAGTTVSDLLCATFPAGSVTGAPKIRAMQISAELEASSRGPYCGSIGMFSACGSMTLNVAIRTIMLQGHRPTLRWDQLDGTLRYGAGGGIVADSEPLAEYRESMDKAAVLRLAIAADSKSCHADLRI